jgi:hypothetical protein
LPPLEVRLDRTPVIPVNQIDTRRRAQIVARERLSEINSEDVIHYSVFEFPPCGS